MWISQQEKKITDEWMTFIKTHDFFCQETDNWLFTYHFDQLRYGDLELHRDWIGHILHRPDELVVPPEQPSK